MSGGSPLDGEAEEAIAEHEKQIKASHGVPPASASHGLAQYPLDPDAARMRLIANMGQQRREVWEHTRDLANAAAMEHRNFTREETDRWEDLNRMLEQIDRRIAVLAQQHREQITLTSMDGSTVSIDAQPTHGGAGGTGTTNALDYDVDAALHRAHRAIDHAIASAEQTNSALERMVGREPVKPKRQAKTRKPCIECHSSSRGERNWVYLEGGRNRRCGYCAELISLKARSPVPVIPLEPKRIVRRRERRSVDELIATQAWLLRRQASLQPRRRLRASRIGMAAVVVWLASMVMVFAAPPSLASASGLVALVATGVGVWQAESFRRR